MNAKPNNARNKLRSVLQRAAQVDLTELLDTAIVRGVGRRASPQQSVLGHGRVEAVVPYSPEYPFSAIDWGLTNKNYPRKKLVVKRTKLIYTDWCFAFDVSNTMRFGTKVDQKLVTGAVVAAALAQAATKKRDRVSQIIYDECGIISSLEDTSADEMALEVLKQDGTRKSRANRLGKCSVERSGMSALVSNLPETQSIVPIISDFMHLTPADRARLTRAASFHRVLCCLVEDPREAEFPEGVSGQITMQDVDTGRLRTMSFAEANRIISEDREKRMADLKSFFKRAHCEFMVFRSDDSNAVIRKKIMRLISRGA